MPDITLPIPVVAGNPVKASEFNTAVDAIEEINSALDLAVGRGILNSSFEEGLTSWVVATGTGGTIIAVDSPNFEGEGASKFTRTAGGGNSGGTLTTEEFILVSPGTGRIRFAIEHDAVLKSSIEVTFYEDDASSVISTIEVGEVDDLETVFRWIEFDDFDIPASSRWMKVHLKGAFEATAGDNAGSAYFDNVTFVQQTVEDNSVSGGGSVPDPQDVWGTIFTNELKLPPNCDNVTLTLTFSVATTTDGDVRLLIGSDSGTEVPVANGFTGLVDVTIGNLIALGHAGTNIVLEAQGKKDNNGQSFGFSTAPSTEDSYDDAIVMTT